MKSVNTWFASVSTNSIIIALVLFEFSIPAFAQSNPQGDQSQDRSNHLDDLQEFARQFREDTSLQPPSEATFEPPPGAKNSARVPSFGAGYAKPRQDVVPLQDNENKSPEQDRAFDPFGDLRPKDAPQTDKNSILDPSPDPPVDERQNQTPPPQQQNTQEQVPDPSPPKQDQTNPFSDDRAVDDLGNLEANPSPTNQRSNENWKRLPPKQPVDEEAIRQWELPPDSVVPGETSQDYRKSTPRQQPRSRVEPYRHPEQDPTQFSPYYNQNFNQNYNQGQPDYWAQPGQADGYQPRPYDPSSGDGFQGNPYQGQPDMGQPYQHDPQYSAYSQSQAGQGTYFENAKGQWGVAGADASGFGCNSCGISDCGFDCEELEFYLSGYGALVDLRNMISGTNSLLTDNGGGWGLALGRRQGLNLRTELEYGWRSNNIIGFDEDGLRSDMTGKIKSQAGMANAYWEFVNFPTRCIKPYVGAGLGFARFDADLRDEFGDSLTPERSEDSSFAYQFMGGINYQPFSTVDLFIEYRLFRTDSFQLETESGFASGRYDYHTSNLVGGLRWKF